MEHNAVTAVAEPGLPTHQVLKPSPVLYSRDVDSVRVRGRKSRREASSDMVGDNGIAHATVAVPDTIRSSGAMRLLASYVAKYFNVAVEARGQVRTITVSREQRAELVKALTAIARCFC